MNSYKKENPKKLSTTKKKLSEPSRSSNVSVCACVFRDALNVVSYLTLLEQKLLEIDYTRNLPLDFRFYNYDWINR